MCWSTPGVLAYCQIHWDVSQTTCVFSVSLKGSITNCMQSYFAEIMLSEDRKLSQWGFITISWCFFSKSCWNQCWCKHLTALLTVALTLADIEDNEYCWLIICCRKKCLFCSINSFLYCHMQCDNICDNVFKSIPKYFCCSASCSCPPGISPLIQIVLQRAVELMHS